MKNYLTLIFVLISLPTLSQNPYNSPADYRRWQVAINFTTDLLNTSYGDNYGIVAKAKRSAFNSRHFQMYYGVAYQHNVIDEHKNLFSDYVKGYTRDIGAYAVYEVVYYPFRQVGVLLSLEPFVGYTHLHSIGKLKMPHHDVYVKYHHNYGYFNYGFTQSLGYTINRFTINGFAMVSLKGMTDSGRFRPGDFDSRILLGVGLAYGF
ncbi:hypothetical protein V6R21_08090 [Limibacter armeniacum]|uniref:hypothetical protein n=1 Tax=Limibacter armeniacum TaxID=466084 RepID=UPI002FE5ACF9